ncbi:hypothetical protein Pcinc_040071 [Petrolisthes cinctipes]|uniref:UFSP1/2/DUB catalytic domain-containing protein n=1 Tax=Petrolisthes cinctipes TaxID=88211 RepID=A0AAE1BMN8_PETCI|nr:hypothetical protein Pcinc_040071 [Petrolisthes cinctipes]
MSLIRDDLCKLQICLTTLALLLVLRSRKKKRAKHKAKEKVLRASKRMRREELARDNEEERKDLKRKVRMVGGQDYTMELLSNVHEWLQLPEGVTEALTVSGDYLYFHYGCDGFDDRGWGCGYRTLMSLCSWVRGQLAIAAPTTITDAPTDTDTPTAAPPIPLSRPPVPSNRRIQEILVEIGDKEDDFVGSKDWIGCVEVSYVLDSLYSTQCKIIHVQRGSDLCEHVDTLRQHFEERGSPIMMGGDTDNASKAIVGMCEGPDDNYLLVVDPHYWGIAKESSELQSRQWVKWQPLSEFTQGSFYNLCLPQLAAHQLTTTTTTTTTAASS